MTQPRSTNGGSEALKAKDLMARIQHLEGRVQRLEAIIEYYSGPLPDDPSQWVKVEFVGQLN